MAIWKPTPAEEEVYGNLALVIRCVGWETQHLLNESRTHRWRPVRACDYINSICTFSITLLLYWTSREQG